MIGNNPGDRSKLGTKRHILTDENGIPLSTIITSASTHDIKAVTDVIDNSISRRISKSFFIKKKRRLYRHLCLDRAYSSKSIENEIIRRGYVPHIPHKRKRGQRKEETIYQKIFSFQK
jgi:putative transposase